MPRLLDRLRDRLRPRLAAKVAAVTASVVVLAGCDFGVYDLPLPGGADTGDDPKQVTVVFRDVLDLVPQSSVKVDEVTVGKVTDVELDPETHYARVTLELNRDTDLPANAEAQIRQTSLLGEKFVSLAAPATGAAAEPLPDDAVIGVERTGRNPEVEEVLGALSLVLNGGGVAQLKTITTELNHALEGREGSARSVLTQLETLMGSLDESKGDIVTAIQALDRLAKSVTRQQRHIDAAMEELPSALESIDGQRDDLVKMLRALRSLGKVGTRVIRQSKAGTIDILNQLEPVLTKLADSGDSLVDALDTAFTYPFVDEVVGRDPQSARALHMGDYVNLDLTLEIDLRKVLANLVEGDLLPDDLKPLTLVNNLIGCVLAVNTSSAACQSLIGTVRNIPNLPNECRDPEYGDNVLCDLLNLIPGLPNLGGGSGGSTGGSRNPQPGQQQPPGGADPLTELGNAIGGLLGIPRAAPGGASASASDPAGGVPTTTSLGTLGRAYDPDLVALLGPGVASAPDQTSARPHGERKAAR